MNRNAAAFGTAAFVLAACASGTGPVDDAGEDPPDRISLATASAPGYEVELLADDPLQVGLNAVYLRVTASGAPVTGAIVSLLPLVTTPSGTRHAPVMGSGASSADGLYRFGAVLDAASGPDLGWSAEVSVAGEGEPATVTFPSLDVKTGKDLARRFRSGASEYVIALEFQARLQVGLNPVVVTLHATEDGGATFGPVNDATLALDPEMPSMGHGSPGSVNPVRTADGWYEGELSFSMQGDWLTTITVKRDGVVVGAPELLVFF